MFVSLAIRFRNTVMNARLILILAKPVWIAILWFMMMPIKNLFVERVCQNILDAQFALKYPLNAKNAGLMHLETNFI